MRDEPGPRLEAPAILPAPVSSITCPPSAFTELSVEILSAGASLRFRARGASMWPLVRDGDVLLVRPVDVRSVRLGDLVLFRDGLGHVLVHRVIRVDTRHEGSRFTVQGDAVLQPDGCISASQVFGRVTAIERNGAQIDMDHRVMQMLGRLAVLRSRRSLGRGVLFGPARGAIKRLPVLSKYLA